MSSILRYIVMQKKRPNYPILPYGTPRQLLTVLRLICRPTGTAAGVGSAGAVVSARFATGCCCRRRSRQECRSPAPSAIDGTAVPLCLAGYWADFRRCILSAVKIDL